MLFDKPKIVIYLTDQNIVVYDAQAEALELEFPPEIVKDQEIIDEEKFKQMLGDFFANLQLKGREAIILISQKLLFQKKFSVDEPEKLNDQIQIYLEKIPFDPQHLAKVQITVEDGVIVVVTNQKLFQIVKDIFQSLGGKVLGIIPASVLGEIGQNKELGLEEAQTLLGNFSDLKKKGLLFSETVVVSKAPGEEAETSHPRNYLLIVGIIVAGLIFWLGISWRLKFYPFTKPKPTLKLITNTASSSAHIAPSRPATGSADKESSASTLPKDKIKIEVFNGTGLSGQAGKARDLLQALGFKDIKTGNYTGNAGGETVVTSSPIIPFSILQEIKKELEKTFWKVSLQTATSSSDVDLSITTGKYAPK